MKCKAYGHAIMSDQTLSADELRRKLSFRSWHRGTREMDMLMGHFSDFILPELDVEGLAHYARLLEENDPDLYNYYCGRDDNGIFPKDVNRSLLQQFKDFKID